jgi:hypothetical protein
MIIFGGRKVAPPGALILPRQVADRDRGAALWPKCARCRRAVDAYGVMNENASSIEIWARCDGVRIDPKSGGSLWDLVRGRPSASLREHPPLKSSSHILKGPGWSVNRFADIVSRLSFFSPDGDRQFTQNLTPEGVARRWTAG